MSGEMKQIGLCGFIKSESVKSMKTLPSLSFLAIAGAIASAAQAQPPALTVYNQDFAVVREHVSLDLASGINQISFPGVTTSLEPDSVVLRDPAGNVDLRILEQSYRAETASPGLLLSLYEGKVIDFVVRNQDGGEYTVPGRVVRSGWTPAGGSESPIVEVDGKLRFSLPGEPVFPDLGGDTILRPTLNWTLAAPAAGKVDAEVSYLTGGLSWEAAYNLILPETGDRMDLVGWVTVHNQSGKRFDEAAVKLMAGNVNKLAPAQKPAPRAEMMMMARMADADVTEKAFDEFHLYTLPRSLTLRDQETKQVEFTRATGVPFKTIYVYDGAQIANYRGWNTEMMRTNPDYGAQSNEQVWVMREFKNTSEAGLGLPLPAGRMRFYRRDEADNRLEFTGENVIKHTPQGETLRIYTGDAFDLVGERKQTDFSYDKRTETADEAFEIRVRNRKKEPAQIRVVEHLNRGLNWRVVEKSADFEKMSAQDIQFTVNLAPDEEKVITYRVRYDYR